MNFNDSGIYGFDISFYQDDNNTPQGINFQKMKSSGADFVIIRGGQNTWIDPDFSTNWANSKSAGLPRAAYWFYDPRASPLSQAKLFCGLVADDKPEGRMWLDLEFPASYGGSYGASNNFRTCLDEIKKLSKCRVGIYTGYYWWHDHVVAADRAQYAQYPLWLAAYTSYPANVKVPSPWSECLIWQDGTPSIGISVGVESKEIDHNKFNGGTTQFANEFGSAAESPSVTKRIKIYSNGTITRS